MNFERFGFIKSFTNPENKDLRARLDIALEQVLKNRGLDDTQKRQDVFFSLFCEFAQTDINLGIEYLLKTTKKTGRW